MSWLPIAPNFRDDLRAALDQAKPGDGLERLAALAAHRLGFLETVQLDRALARLDLKEAPGFTSVRLALLASSTVDHLPPAIRVAGAAARRARSRYDVRAAAARPSSLSASFR